MPSGNDARALEAALDIQSNYLTSGNGAAALTAVLEAVLRYGGGTVGLLAEVCRSADGAWTLCVRARAPAGNASLHGPQPAPWLTDVLAGAPSGAGLPLPRTAAAALLPDLPEAAAAVALPLAAREEPLGVLVLAGLPPHGDPLPARVAPLLRCAATLLAAGAAARVPTPPGSLQGFDREQLLQAVFDHLPHALSVKDADGRYVLANRWFAQHTGISPECLAGLRDQDLAAMPDSAKQWLRELDQHVLATGRTVDWPGFAIRWGNGNVRYRDLVKAPVTDAQGRCVGVITSATDVTARQTAELQVRSNQRLLRAVFDTIPHVIAVKDREGRYVMVNSAYQTQFGVPAERLVGRRAEEVEEFSVELRRSFHEGDRLVLSGTMNNFHMEQRLSLADGRTCYLDRYKTALLDENGEIEGLVGIAINVTEHREAEARAQLAHARLIDAIETMPAVFLLFDPSERLVLWNSRLVEVFPEFGGVVRNGMTYEEICRLVAPLYVSENGLEQSIAERLRAFRHLENRGVRQRKDGRWVQYHDHRTADGGTVSLRFDVTEQRNREVELRQAQKMEAVGQLTGGVAHDFNNLLTVILGNLELLGQLVPEPPKAQRLIERALAAGTRGAALTRRLLAFSRRQVLQARITEVNELVQAIMELMRRTLGETVRVQTELAPDLWPTLVDPTQLENALLNLAINARDAMGRGGQLTIATENVWLTDRDAAALGEVEPGPYVLVSVSDTGCGIPAELIERVFDPFFTTKEVGKGSGLGLSMVYGFVKQSAGHVRLSSEEGRGTTVQVYLPRAPHAEQPAALAAAAGAPPAGAGERVLIVEDDPHIALLAREIIAELGYTTLEAADAAGALAQLRSTPEVVLLFTDVVLPGGRSGMDLAEEALRLYPHLKVLYTTGYTEHEQLRKGLRPEGAQLLAKPYRVQELADKLRSTLQASGGVAGSAQA